MVTACAGALNLLFSSNPVISLQFHLCLVESRLNNLFGRYHKPTPGAVGSARVKEVEAGITSRARVRLQPEAVHLALQRGRPTGPGEPGL